MTIANTSAKAPKSTPSLKKILNSCTTNLYVVLQRKIKEACILRKRTQDCLVFISFQYSKTFEQPVGSIHLMLQFKSHNWNKYKEVDFDNAVVSSVPSHCRMLAVV